MAGCGCESNIQFDGKTRSFTTALCIVIAINALMFVVEMGASLVSDSMALRADALDFLGDSLTYTITLIALGHSLRWRATAALIKGSTLALMGAWVLGSTLYRVLFLGMPNELIMGSVAIAALGANLISVLLLLKFRNGDSNVRSVWLCSRNDAIGNLAVLLAAGLVHTSQSPWPDLIVALLMALLFLHSATLILRLASRELESVRSADAQP